MACSSSLIWFGATSLRLRDSIISSCILTRLVFGLRAATLLCSSCLRMGVHSMSSTLCAALHHCAAVTSGSTRSMAMSGCRLRGDGADSQHRPRVDGGGLAPLRRTRTPTGDPAAQQHRRVSCGEGLVSLVLAGVANWMLL